MPATLQERLNASRATLHRWHGPGTAGKTPVGSALSPGLVPVIGATSTWTRTPAHRVHRRTKFKAVRSYRSQLRHLGLGNIGLHRMLWREVAQGREAITWLS